MSQKKQHPRKHLEDLVDAEAIKKLFPKRVVSEANRAITPVKPTKTKTSKRS